MTFVESLQANQDKLIVLVGAYMEALTDALENPKPSYSIDGRSISWAEFRSGLLDDIAKLNEQINSLTDQISAQSPYLVTTRQVV